MCKTNIKENTQQKKNKKTIYQKFIDGESAKLINYSMIAFGLVLMFLPLIFTKISWISFDYVNTGEVGDIIGGSTSPFIGFAGVILTFYAFWVQYQSNISQRNDIKLERFENKFYELLRLHRSNVDEMNIANKVLGRKVFFHMFYELRFLYWTLHSLNSNHNLSFSDEELTKLAYKIFFCGIGYNPDKELNSWLNTDEKNFLTKYEAPISKTRPVNSIRDLYIHIQKQFQEKEDTSRTKNRFEWKHPIFSSSDEYSLEIPYYPFDGHAGKLGHYFRHLFQIVDFVSKQGSDLLSEEDKYEYLKVLRAQLSNYEQLMLFYNSVSGFGQKWIDKKYLTTYRLIKNMPIPLADFGVLPHEVFKEEIEYLKRNGKKLFESDEYNRG